MFVYVWNYITINFNMHVCMYITIMVYTNVYILTFVINIKHV